jgi:hypothetical protein
LKKINLKIRKISSFNDNNNTRDNGTLLDNSIKKVDGSNDRSSIPTRAGIIQITSTATLVMRVIWPSSEKYLSQSANWRQDQKHHILFLIISLTPIIRKSVKCMRFAECNNTAFSM